MKLSIEVTKDMKLKRIAALTKPDKGVRIAAMMSILPTSNVYVMMGFSSIQDAQKIYKKQFEEALKENPEHSEEIIQAAINTPIVLVEMDLGEINAVLVEPREYMKLPNNDFAVAFLTDAAQKYWDAGVPVTYDLDKTN